MSCSRPVCVSAIILSAVTILLFSPYAAEASSDKKTIFTDITQEAGITWHHFSGESPDRFLIETMGGGVAFLDFDNDGLQDIFFVNGGETPHGKSPVPVRNALYRNLGNGRFEEVAAKAGVDRLDSYGMGVAVGDYDNDGYPDLFITGFPASTLFHNNGNGTFTEVTDKARLKNPGKWAASAAWFDYDRDGYLDLVVTNYVRFSFDDPKKCEVNGMRSYCEQLAYQGMPLTLYHNNRDGTFTDVSTQSGLEFSYVYDLPFGRGRKFAGGMNPVLNGILGGWQINGTYRYASGRPLHITLGGGQEIPTYSSDQRRPNLNGILKRNTGPDFVDNYFANAQDVLSRPADFTIGDAPRSITSARQPPSNNTTMSLFKQFSIREGMRLEFRTEAFNALNHPQFCGPNNGNTRVSFDSSGKIDNTSNFAAITDTCIDT